MFNKLILVITMMGISASAFSSTDYFDDSDISGNYPAIRVESPQLSPDGIEEYDFASGYSVEVLRYDHGNYRVIEGLPIVAQAGFGEEEVIQTDGMGFAGSTNCSPGSTIRLTAVLQSEHFYISNDSNIYTVVQDVRCGKHTRILFGQETASGQAIGIWQVARLAEVKLSQAVDLAFWRTPTRFIWPADSDYYSRGTVHISRGDHWDVVGHEMGHAIYSAAGIGASEGGQHYIDRCYSGTMALSEGWASYFSAWVNLDLSDPDARFEYMVPRRAPIRFENIPADVCKGSANEWRVTGFFWDLIDLNNDGENVNETFATLWNALLNGRSRDSRAAANKIVRAGVSQDLVNLSWMLNFQEN